MNNELGRKITSLTLMTIMLTWSGSMAFTGSFLPEAEAANQYLWASVESYDNHFYGPQVLEIVVTDPTINALDTAYGMPDVTIDGKKVIMAQGVDGSWYAYVADATFASTVDALYTENEDGKGADYGTWCNPGTNLEYGPYAGSTPTRKAVSPLVPSETRGVIIPHQLGNGTVAGATTNGNVAGGGYANEATNSYAGQYGNIGTAQVTYTKGTSISTSYCDNDVNGQTSFESAYGSGIWLNSTSVAHTQGAGGTGVNASGEAINNVVREARALSNGTSDYYGNIGLGPNLWPFIQVYDFTRYMTYDLVYERGGADESIGIVFDRPGGQGLTFDRDVYGLLHEVGVTITNNELNIDPTDEDSWTYNTQWQNGTVYYQVYDENGANEAIGNNINDGLVPQSNAQMQSNWGSDEGTLQIDRNGPNDSAKSIVNFQSNSDTATLTCTSGACYGAGFATTEVQATFVETGSNTGVFKNWDEDLKTNIFINAEAARGTQAIFLWNDQQYSVLHMPSWGTVSFNTEAIGSEWNSGEIVGVTVTDNDMNLDARTLNQQAISSNQTIVPAIKIGSPITLASVGAIDYTHVATFNRDESDFGHTINLDTISTQCSSNYGAAGTDASYVSCYEKYSERAILTTSTNPPTTAEDDILKFNYTGATVRDLEDLIASANGTSAYTYIQYDFRAFNGGDSGDYYLNFTIGDNSIDSTSASTSAGSQGHSLFPSRQSTGLVGSVLINAPDDCTTCTLNDKKMIGFGSLTATDDLRVFVEFSLLNGITGFDMATGTSYPIAMDFVTYGQSNDGVASSDRHNNAIYRLEVDETGANTGTYVAEVEYIMLNQLNVNATATYNATKHYDDATVIIVHNDLTDEDEVRINYLDMGADGVETQVADQLAAPTHSGVVEFDNDSYKEADTVVVTLTDSDLNTNPDIINIYTTVTTVPTTLEGISTNGYNDVAYDQVGKAGFGTNSVGDNNGRMLDITFDDEQWLAYSVGSTTCSSAPSGDDGLAASGFTLVETGSDTGVFTGDFQVPAEFCARSSGSGTVSSVMGTDIEVNYVDYRDASGEIIEVGDGAGVRANTGSVSLDRTVYPVPFGTVNDFPAENAKSNPNGRSIFPVHGTGITSFLDAATETIGNGDLTIHIRVDDPDYDLSASGEDKINENTTTSSNRGPLKIYVSRGSDSLVLATAGADTAQVGKITIGSTPVVNSGTQNTVELGPILETAPDSGVFELDMTVRYTDGPASSNCPSITDNWTPKNGDTNETGTASNNGETTRFASAATTGDYCILQGDVITVEYSDQNDASGNSGVAFDSATFDLRNGVLQTDKSVYIIGSDIIMTLIEPDLDLESDESETWDLDLIEWDGDAATVTMGNNGGVASSFDPEPSDFRETGDSTGIFQIVIEMPSTLSGTALDRGEAIGLEYSDWGPSGSNYVGEEYQDVALSIYTSNFGATIELDQKVYTWTDKVYITIVAPDHNFDSGLVDQIGDTDDDPLIVQTRSQKLTSYKLAETGTDTGIFSGEVILKGFNHDADGDPSTGDATNGYDVTAISSASGSGPTDGAIKAEDDDGLTISYEFNEDEVVVGSALIRWNIGEIQWLDTSYPAGGNGVVRVVDPDMNWDPENVNNFEVDVWSDSDAGGISLMVTETNEATGIFEGTVTFTADSESSGHRLRVAEGDTITVEYEDNTLPDPYTRGDDLDVTGTALIGTVVPPLDRAPASNARVVDSFGNSLSEVSVDQQVQIEADLVNGQDRDQSFAYLVQVQDGNGVTVSLAWITGQLAAGQSFSPALSWIPSTSGSYEATVFVWESVDNPTALSDTVSVSIRVV